MSPLERRWRRAPRFRVGVCWTWYGNGMHRSVEVECVETCAGCLYKRIMALPDLDKLANPYTRMVISPQYALWRESVAVSVSVLIEEGDLSKEVSDGQSCP